MEDLRDVPGHNFTCALLCVVCGLPREKHAPAQPEKPYSERLGRPIPAWKAPAQPEEGKRWPCGHERVHPEDELCRECSP